MNKYEILIVGTLMSLLTSFFFKDLVLVATFTCIAIFFVLKRIGITNVIRKWNDLKSEKKCEFVKCFLVVSVFIICGSAMIVRSKYLKVELSTVGGVILIGCYLPFLFYSILRLAKESKRVSIKEAFKKA